MANNKGVMGLSLLQYSSEGDTEHAIADQLVQEINASPDDNEWCAEVKVLAELVEHQIHDEEGKMLEEVKKQIALPARLVIGAEYSKLLFEYRTLYFKQPSEKVRFGSSNGGFQNKISKLKENQTTN